MGSASVRPHATASPCPATGAASAPPQRLRKQLRPHRPVPAWPEPRPCGSAGRGRLSTGTVLGPGQPLCRPRPLSLPSPASGFGEPGRIPSPPFPSRGASRAGAGGLCGSPVPALAVTPRCARRGCAGWVTRAAPRPTASRGRRRVQGCRGQGPPGGSALPSSRLHGAGMGLDPGDGSWPPAHCLPQLCRAVAPMGAGFAGLSPALRRCFHILPSTLSPQSCPSPCSGVGEPGPDALPPRCPGRGPRPAGRQTGG